MTNAARVLLWPTAAALPALVVLLLLGTWQLERLSWKTRLIADVAERTAAPAVALPPEAVWPAVDPAETEYRPVVVTGRFLHEKEVHVFHTLATPKGRLGGQGYFVVTPLLRADGSVVVVNRGFVPLDRKAPETRAEGQIAGEVTLEGLLRRPEAGNPFTPANDPARNVWFTREAREIARAAGLDPARVFPMTVDARPAATPAGGLPQAGETLVRFTNNHLQYAVTWYGLALTLIGVYAAFARARLRRVRDDASTA